MLDESIGKQRTFVLIQMLAAKPPIAIRTRLRLLVVAIQLALYAIVPALAPDLPPIWQQIFLSFLFIVGPLAVASLGYMPLGAALVWAIVFGGVAVAVPQGLHQSFERPSGLDNISSSFGHIVEMAVLLFACHSFVVAGASDRRWIANYSTYVRVSWTLAAQILLVVLSAFALVSGVSTLAGWIGPESTIAVVNWIVFPALCLIVLTVFELSERRPQAIGAVRTFLMSTLSWSLLPAVVGGAFALVQAGLQSNEFWSGSDMPAMLPLSVGCLLLFFNARFRDGQPERLRLMTAIRLSAVCLLLAVVLLYGLALVAQYARSRWTPDVVQGTAIFAVMACYGVGYAIAAVSSGAAMRSVPEINIAAALLGIALTFALSTPLLNPTRLAVAYQIARLESGEVAPEKFDYELLALYAAPYGRPALERLIEERGGPDADEIARRARAALRAPAKGGR
ncbi:MAG: hypothetical protein JSR24_19895 [Proteobacteria bacterium]|nr:hypothetical protein [Pseudomonadota bacterium]